MKAQFRRGDVAHPAYCLTRKDVAFVSGNTQWEYVHGRHADKVEMNVRGQKGDQDQIGEVRPRTRNETSGPQSGYRADSGAVALMVELMSRHDVARRRPTILIPYLRFLQNRIE